MRVLLTLPSLAQEFGGPVEKARALAAALRAAGLDVTLMGAGRDSADETVALRPISRFHSTPIPLGLQRIGRWVEWADIVHVIGYRDPVCILSAFASVLLGRPYLLEPIGTYRRRNRSLRLKAMFDGTLGRAVTNRASLVIANSLREAQELASGGILTSQIAVRPNGVDIEQFRRLPPRGAFRARLRIGADTPLVLTLGRITRKKGLPMLVEAVSRVPKAHLAIVGPDDRDGTLGAVFQICEQMGIDDRVHVLQAGLWGSQKTEAFVDSDLFCLFSEHENFGMAAAEAAACGVAVVLSDRCGVAEWLDGGVETVPYGDVNKLAGTLSALLADANRRTKLAATGQKAVAAFTPERVAQQQAEIYKRIADSR